MRRGIFSSYKSALAGLGCCCLLAACHPGDTEDHQAGETLHSWKGQKVRFALDTLGRPSSVVANATGEVYTWNGTREIANGFVTSAGVGSHAVASINNANADRESIEPCRLSILTDAHNTMINFNFKGTSLGCQPFADLINSPPEVAIAHRNFATMIGKPLQTALDVLGIPNSETVNHKKQATYYKWRNTKDDKSCVAYAAADKDGIIRYVHIKGSNDVCTPIVHKLATADASQAANVPQ